MASKFSLRFFAFALWLRKNYVDDLTIYIFKNVKKLAKREIFEEM